MPIAVDLPVLFYLSLRNRYQYVHFYRFEGYLREWWDRLLSNSMWPIAYTATDDSQLQSAIRGFPGLQLSRSDNVYATITHVKVPKLSFSLINPLHISNSVRLMETVPKKRLKSDHIWPLTTRSNNAKNPSDLEGKTWQSKTLTAQ